MYQLTNRIRAFEGKKIVVIGDIVADQFLSGTISRVSREAPVLILRHDETETRPGGGANAAANIAALGGNPILVGVVGTDKSGDHLREALREAKVDETGVIRDGQVTTTTKVRVLAGQHYASRQQVLRIDHENRVPLSGELRESLRLSTVKALESADAVIVSDYGYGVIDDEIFRIIVSSAETAKVPVLIDSRFSLGNFKGATAATPNQDEVEQILGKAFADQDCRRLREDMGLEALLVTCGNQGMNLFTEAGKLHINAVGSTSPVDVTGAGDTVIATFALAIASGFPYPDAALTANHAGGLVVMKKGTATVSLEEIINSMNNEESGPEVSAATD